MADHTLPKDVDSARAAGSPRYFTGRPCKRGHVAERFTNNKTCLDCHRESQTARYHRSPDKIRSRVKAYRERNKEACAAYAKRYAEENRPQLTAYYAARYREKAQYIKLKAKLYRASRPGFGNECGKAYLLRKSRAMPHWVDRDELRKIYAEAERRTKETGTVYSVDHIYPLKGRNFCGLHVPWNLQIIPKLDNCRKATKHPDDWAASQGLDLPA